MPGGGLARMVGGVGVGGMTNSGQSEGHHQEICIQRGGGYLIFFTFVLFSNKCIQCSRHQWYMVHDGCKPLKG